jgi:hypothetical protein
MKILEIKNSRGYFYLGNGKKIEIDKINKESIIKLLELVINEDVEMDDYHEQENKHPAQEIIYKTIYDKLYELKNNKDIFRNGASELYKEALEKYKIEKDSSE